MANTPMGYLPQGWDGDAAVSVPCTRQVVLARPFLPCTQGCAQPSLKRYPGTLLVSRCDNAPEAYR
ncbi:hypothetical protein [Streptomyces sp. I05A-00742]|uniref:hypothetical protein n=1 Tax=Streptomyces sp. I05A-00742 TaxID=2732853 RepID=UPI0014899526|nr:hypothetical protein [Streptomyces sp. I05A-00742]